MAWHHIAFYTAIFFMAGVLAASIFSGSAGAIIFSGVTALAATAFFWRYDKKSIAIFTPFIIAGAIYYSIYDIAQRATPPEYGGAVNIEGVVRKVEEYEKGQKIYIGAVKIYAPNYPIYEYGDRLEVFGAIKEIKPELRNIFLKDGVLGTMSYPEIRLLGRGGGNPATAVLFKLKARVLRTFAAVLPYQKSQFLAGITLGEKSAFSEDFRQDLSRSGTAHLVALSGYNISVLLDNLAIGGAFWLPLGIVVLFVLMTGAEASIVRAAIMGGIILLSGRVNRVYSFRNAITIAAFFMTLQNPKILAFDLGFQLSFAALLGIVYLRPIIAQGLRMKPGPGFLKWRENLQGTIAAQIAVLPLILKSFGSLSISGVVSNILILPAIPYTMFLGFVTGVAGFISDYLPRAFGFFTEPFIAYELGVIKFFGRFGFAEGISIGWIFVIIYYAALILGIKYFHKYGFQRREK